MESNQREQLKKWWEDLLVFSPRTMGSSGEKDAVNYLVNELNNLGIKSEIQSFTYPGWELVSFTGLHIESSGEELVESYPALGSGSGKVIQGKLVEIGESVIWDMYNWPRLGVFTHHGEIAAYISARLGGKALSQTLIMNNNTKPHLFIGEDTYRLWQEQLKNQKEILVNFELEVIHTPEKEGQNICVRIPGNSDFIDKKTFKIIIGAHYDTMYNTIGAYDNTSGVAVLLGLIQWFQQQRLPFQVEFVFFGAEEFALSGSKAYVEKLTNKELEEIDLMINLDGFGRGEELECWVGADWLEQLICNKLMNSSHFSRWKMKSPPPPGSDHTPFFQKDIPVVMFTVNDQEILHSERDVPHQAMFLNMIKVLEFLKELLSQDLVELKEKQ
ncbi:M20/M25/M40 family metallo-hydrolase [Neobacillus mesonae]|uniref:M20/M25/M40 family metallo-hydrolase n=1 Tax=Neobacillus mesonae TaxID=1193713 RepID=UPI00203C7BE3|nr:M20/M25/M40 family metallo-hydrolase [Neobacillus mesonae]MCM3568973.1 M20/M25/M40 family metallo-hydrolase [Neobacillus mesonae]